MDNTLQALKALLKKKRFWLSLFFLLGALGVTSDSVPVDTLASLVCSVLGGCTP